MTPSLCACACLSVCVSVPRKWFLWNYWSYHHQTWHGDCLTRENASRVHYIDLDLHSRPQILTMMKTTNVGLFQKLNKGKLLTEGCSATCSSLPLPKPVGILPAVRFRDLDFENIYLAWPSCSSFFFPPRECDAQKRDNPKSTTTASFKENMHQCCC